MGEVAEIEVKRIYPFKAMMFGLVLGAIVGVIEAILFILSYFLFQEGLSGLYGSSVSTGIVLLSSGVLIVGTAIFNFVAFGIMALIYNLLSKIGVPIDVDLQEILVKKVN